MTINERLQFLRKQLKLTTRAFGASINMSGGAITNMEKGLRNITDRTIKDICREYHINSEWLTNGIEPMYEDVISDLDIDEEVKQLTKQYYLLNDKDRELVKKMIDSLSEKLQEKSSETDANSDEGIRVFRAAKSINNDQPPQIVTLTKEQAELLDNTPFIDLDI